MSEWAEYADQLTKQARQASRQLALVSGAQKQRWLHRAAELLVVRAEEVVAANQRDLEAAPGYGLNAAAIDRLKLTPQRLKSVAAALADVALLPDPIGEVIDSTVRPNGLSVNRVRVPLGVVFFIYESRPNVTIDAASLCLKSGNAVILRGGKEALHSNLALHRILTDALIETGLPEHAVQLVQTTERAVVGELLKRGDRIDVTIPRGGKSLIERVVSEATMPVIKHFDGICHVYVDESANFDMALAILKNSKCQRPGVCNAAECLLVHAAIAETFLPKAAAMLHAEKVEMRGCPRTCRLIPTAKPATDADFRTEYLDLILSIKVVDDLTAAIDHIDAYGSHHTETIVTTNLPAAMRFTAEVDSAGVIVNASTRFNDGGEFGLGAEIGISTDKFHARGPCGLRELTSYKWVAYGTGQIRE
ncbi:MULTISPECIES: glutamate-5-semialdehyde dehydrogenase [unclassified Schlesneria]|uniref:glutamate-5-semialdehyde dehydrogenase n=1 Tax=Schlesneria TaxID=656899 RepID=UPI0035A08A0F